MMDRPILFSGPMVRAILDGRKTKTRRVLNPQPPHGEWRIADRDEDQVLWMCDKGTHVQAKLRFATGDRLWVRENWSHSADGVWSISDARLMGPSGALYAADGLQNAKWFASIHMPREFSRLTLIVESVKVERLQDISEEDAIAEGCDISEEQIALNDDLRNRPKPVHGDRWFLMSARGNFIETWCDINGGIDAWDTNPWCAAISFRAIKANIDTLAKEAA